MTELYRCDVANGAYTIRKFDEDYSLLSKYTTTSTTCDCPRAEHRTCRHRHTILPMFLAHEHVGDGWFLNFHTHQWIEPVEDYKPDEALVKEIAKEHPQVARYISEGCDGATPVTPAQVTPAKAPSTFRRRI
jgi:hypothetical protein